MTRHAPLSEEARLQVAVVAGATERSNRPRFLLLLALLALIGAGIYAGLSARTLAAARAGVREKLDSAAAVERLGEELRQTLAARAEDGAAPDPQAAQKLRQLATQLGLPASLGLGTSQQAASSGYVKKRYTTGAFRVNDIGPVVDWLQQATGSNTVGLTNVEIQSAKLRPLRTGATGGWEVDVTFTRLERDR